MSIVGTCEEFLHDKCLFIYEKTCFVKTPSNIQHDYFNLWQTTIQIPGLLLYFQKVQQNKKSY